MANLNLTRPVQLAAGEDFGDGDFTNPHEELKFHTAMARLQLKLSRTSRHESKNPAYADIADTLKQNAVHHLGMHHYHKAAAKQLAHREPEKHEPRSQPLRAQQNGGK